jgi:hypothetical protein
MKQEKSKKKKWKQKRPFKPNIFLFEQVGIIESNLLFQSKLSESVFQSWKHQSMNEALGPLRIANILTPAGTEALHWGAFDAATGLWRSKKEIT